MQSYNYEPMIQTPIDALDEISDMAINYTQDCDIANAYFKTFDNTQEPRHTFADVSLKELSQFKNYYKLLDPYKTRENGFVGAVDLIQQYETAIANHLYTKINTANIIANTVDAVRAQCALRTVLLNAGLTENDTFTKNNITKLNKAINKLRKEWSNA